jgi:hypothetical protein
LATAVGLVGLSTTSMVPSMIFAAIIGIIGSAILMSLLMALF